MSINPLLKEIIALIINDDKSWKILYFNFPDCFHAQLWVLEYLDFADAVLCEDGGGASDAAQVESPVGFARFGYLGTAVALSQGDETPSVLHERVQVRVHTTSSCRPERT
jgi:hypothetical protein